MYAAFVLNLAEHIRYVAAVGSEITSRHLLLGQFVLDRSDPAHRRKFDPFAAPDLFDEWRFDTGSESSLQARH